MTRPYSLAFEQKMIDSIGSIATSFGRFSRLSSIRAALHDRVRSVYDNGDGRDDIEVTFLSPTSRAARM